jgi:hypothetical protein
MAFHSRSLRSRYTVTGDAGTRGYLEGHPSLKGRVAFLRAEPGEDHAARY